MKKYIALFLALFFLTISFNVNAQEVKEKEVKEEKTQESTAKDVTNRLSLSLGGVMSSFQDVSFSTNQYLGFGATVGVDFLKMKKKAIWGISFLGNFSGEQPSTFSLDQSVTALNFQLSAKYLKPTISIAGAPLYVGAALDLPELLVRSTGELSNNSTNLILSSNIKLSSMYKKKLSEELSLEAGLDIQLFSFIRDFSSFSFFFPQTPLEKGEYNYQDALVSRGIFLNLSAYEFRPLWKYFSLNTAIRLNYKEKWGLSYKWNYRLSTRVENYPVHIGYNLLAITYNIINKKR